MGKPKIACICLVFVSLNICCAKIEDSVVARWDCFEDYLNGMGRTIFYISKDKCTCSLEQGRGKTTMAIDDFISNELWSLSDSIFIDRSALMYSYWKSTDNCEFDEGDLLSFVVTKDGEEEQIRHQLGNIYYHSNEIQLTEDHHEYIYSHTFRLFLQYLDLLHAYFTGKEAWRNYTDDVRKMSKAPEANVFPVILQVCDYLDMTKKNLNFK